MQRSRRNPYAEPLPSDWSRWTKAQRKAWRRRTFISRPGEKPRSLAQRALARRGRELARRNPRETFDHFDIVKYYARKKGREDRQRRDEQKSRAITQRLPVYRKANPFTEGEVRTVVKEFKRKYGGQALGWAKDAASLQHRGSESERMYSKVVVALRDGLYAHSNPKNDGSPTRGERHARRAKEWARKHPKTARVERVDPRLADIEARMACVRDQLRATEDDAVAERLTQELTALAASKRSNPARRRRR